MEMMVFHQIWGRWSSWLLAFSPAESGNVDEYCCCSMHQGQTISIWIGDHLSSDCPQHMISRMWPLEAPMILLHFSTKLFDSQAEFPGKFYLKQAEHFSHPPSVCRAFAIKMYHQNLGLWAHIHTHHNHSHCGITSTLKVTAAQGVTEFWIKYHFQPHDFWVRLFGAFQIPTVVTNYFHTN